MTTFDQPVLSDDQQTLVWEGLIGSETRAQYFGELVPRLRTRQRWLTVGSLVLSSGAAISLLTSAFPNYNWAKALLAIASAVLSAISLVSSNEKNAIEASDLHYRWQTLATAYRNLWSNMYAEDAEESLHRLQEQEATVSKSSTAMPNIVKLVLKAEENVAMHHTTKLPARRPKTIRQATHRTLFLPRIIFALKAQSTLAWGKAPGRRAWNLRAEGPRYSRVPHISLLRCGSSTSPPIDLRLTPIYPDPVNVSLQYAQEHLSDLISAADRGEEVEITRPDKPVLRLVTSPETGVRKIGNRSNLFGQWEGLITLPTDEEWAAMDKEIEDEMVNGPIFPDEHP